VLASAGVAASLRALDGLTFSIWPVPYEKMYMHHLLTFAGAAETINQQAMVPS
jgi:hypothetical protein